MTEAVHHYRADITAGALKLPETRVIADLLLLHIKKADRTVRQAGPRAYHQDRQHGEGDVEHVG